MFNVLDKQIVLDQASLIVVHGSVVYQHNRLLCHTSLSHDVYYLLSLYVKWLLIFFYNPWVHEVHLFKKCLNKNLLLQFVSCVGFWKKECITIISCKKRAMSYKYKFEVTNNLLDTYILISNKIYILPKNVVKLEM